MDMDAEKTAIWIPNPYNSGAISKDAREKLLDSLRRIKVVISIGELRSVADGQHANVNDDGSVYYVFDNTSLWMKEEQVSLLVALGMLFHDEWVRSHLKDGWKYSENGDDDEKKLSGDFFVSALSQI
eukprot:tig00020592_g11681.t1